MMKDDKKEHNNKYEKLASFLEDPQDLTNMNEASSDDEVRKLLFMWNECQPAETDSSEVWEKTLQRIRQAQAQEAESRRRHISLAWRWVAAASVVLCVGLGSLWFSKTEVTVDERSRMEQMLLAQVDTGEVKEVTLVVSDRKKVELANNAKVAYNASGQVSVNSVKLKEPSVQKEETSAQTSSEEAMEYNQLIVPKGRRSMIVLADNSKMWINSGSKVIYPRAFKGDRREIFVEGEVYLKVSRDESKPFIVNTSAFDVEVLGTSFNVSAYKGDAHASVVLVEGAVDVKDAADKHVLMQPNERVQLDEAGELKKETVNALDYIHWVDGVWILNGKPLKEVLAYLSEYYGQKIVCDPSIADEAFYGKLFLNEELKKVLESIWQTLPEDLGFSRESIYVQVN